VLSLDHIGRTVAQRTQGRVEIGLDIERWIDRAIKRFTDTYAATLAAADLELAFDPVLLRALCFEKETYEYVYAARLLPSWLYAPRGGMARLLRQGAP
jgi:predicted trehalose synthase